MKVDEGGELQQMVCVLSLRLRLFYLWKKSAP